MSRTSSQSLILALALCTGILQPAYSQGGTASGPTGPQTTQAQLCLPTTMQTPVQQTTGHTTPSTTGNPPTLGQVLDQEALKQQAQPGYAPQGSVPQGVAPQGYAPQGYPAQGYVQPRQGVGGLINDIRGLVKDMVQVDPTGNQNVKVRVPFVNVDVNNGQPNVKVNAPFVHVTKSGNDPVSVQAPFVNLSPQTPKTP